MRDMSGGPCLHWDCSNRNSFGYCKTTVCINELYKRGQWGLPSTTNKPESVVIKQQTNADRIRAMTDEELAEWLTMTERRVIKNALSKPYMYTDEQLKADWLDWLRQEGDDGASVY